MPSIIIIGGGISGLATAYYLAKGGASPTLIESRSRLGGVIQTEKIEGCTIEAGPDSFLSVKPAAMDLIADLDCAAMSSGPTIICGSPSCARAGNSCLCPTD